MNKFYNAVYIVSIYYYPYYRKPLVYNNIHSMLDY